MGNYFAANLNKRVRTLKSVGYMLDEIEMLLKYRSATVYEIIENLNNDKRFSELGFILEIADKCRDTDIPFNDIWCSCIDKHTEIFLKKEDKDLICSIGQYLGTSDAETQLNTIQIKKGELSAFLKNAEEDLLKKAKLYRSIGILAGAFISIMIL